MKFDFVADRQTKIKTFLKGHGVSRGLLAKVKLKGGSIWTNGVERNAIYLLNVGDVVTTEIPDEEEHETLVPAKHDLNIAYGDGHFLIINKPHGYASIPSVLYPDTIANFVKHYYLEQNYPNKQVHIVTRLDKDTSGLMLLAKHSYVHARLDEQLQNRIIEKRHYALVSDKGELVDKGETIAPIARLDNSIITRRVHSSGKYAYTSYEAMACFGEVALVDIRLHTGHIHQTRVHLSHTGSLLLGDDMYGGSTDYGTTRQALYCYYLRFINPYINEEIIQATSLTDDFDSVIMEL